MHLRTHALLLLLTSISGANYTLLKLLVPTAMAPNAVICARIVLGTVAFGLVAWHMKQIRIAPPPKDVLLLVLSGFFGVFANQFFFYQGMKITTPINGSIFNLTNPVTVVLFSALLLGERLTWHTVGGMCVAIVGAVTLLDFKSFAVTGSTFWGDVSVLVNAISFGIYVVLVTPLTKRYGVWATAFYTFASALVFVLPVGLNDLVHTQWGGFEPIHWWVLGYILIFTTLVVYFLNNYLPTITSPHLLAIYVYLQPFIATLVALGMGKDVLTGSKIMSGLLILGGIAWVQYSKRKWNKPKQDGTKA